MTIINNKLFFLIALISPLISFFIIGLFGTNFFINIINKKFINFIAISSILISTLISIKTFLLTLNGNIYDINLYTWLKLNNFKIKTGLLIDNLSSTMMVIITLISLIVYIYSIEYMKNDNSYKRFFCYLSLFTFSILTLVMSNNLLQLFFAWELVGIVSYLLIGFWYKKKKANKANIKSFLINRIGDCGIIISIGLIFSYLNSLNYNIIFKNIHYLKNIYLPKTNILIITIICLFLFIGVITKSAQFPFHVWLPDSMEGPTPVSALIHAATMVTAGIFMVSRMSPLFELSKTSLSIILIIGGITSIFMGILATIQNDIKKIIAYSTLSQLGYMTMALGASAYSIAIFHLITHAFFKALLFLCAGSLIINNNHIQDIRYMNNIKKYIPITWITFLISIFSLVGIPFFSGFYSKESIIKILLKSKIIGSNFAYFASLFSVLITSIYSFRMYFKIFHKNINKKIKNKESNYLITIPLIILSIPSILLGYFLTPLVLKNFFKKNIIINIKHLNKYFINSFKIGIKFWKTLPFWLIIIGFIITYYMYIININTTNYLKKKFKFLYKILKKKYFIDILYEKKITKFFLYFCKKIFLIIDKKIINNFIILKIIKIIKIISKYTKLFNSGYIHKYIFAMIIGLLIIIIYLLLPIKFYLIK